MIYIDFECLAPPKLRRDPAQSTPLLLGVLWTDATITQFIVDERLADAARAVRDHCRVSTVHDAIVEIVEKAHSAGCGIVSWSTFDNSVAHAHGSLSTAESEAFDAVYVNALARAPEWARATHVRLRGDKKEGNTLSRYCEATGYTVPPGLAALKPARYLRTVLNQLDAGGRYRALKPRAKRRWHDVLGYNRYDLLGLQHVHERVTHDLAVLDWYRRGQIEIQIEGHAVRWAVDAGPKPRFIRALEAAAAERYVVLVADPFVAPDLGQPCVWLDAMSVSLAEQGIQAWPAVFFGGAGAAARRPALVALGVKRKAGSALARRHGLRMFIRGHRGGPAQSTWCGNVKAK